MFYKGFVMTVVNEPKRSMPGYGGTVMGQETRVEQTAATPAFRDISPPQSAGLFLVFPEMAEDARESLMHRRNACGE